MFCVRQWRKRKQKYILDPIDLLVLSMGHRFLVGVLDIPTYISKGLQKNYKYEMH